jgi:HlyD family secretion protein
MQASSGLSAPEPGGRPAVSPQSPVPSPSVVPPKEPTERRPKALWGTILAAAILIGGAAWYWNQRSDTKSPGKGGRIAAVPTVAVSLGDLSQTIRVSGTIAAQNFAAVLAPRIRGSRGDFNRGGSRGASPTTSGGNAGPGGGGGGGGGGDFSLILLKLEKAGARVKAGDVVAQFDPQFQAQRYDDYKDSVVQLEDTIKKMRADLAATKEAHDQSVRTAKADWETALLDLKTADVRSRIDAEKFKLTAEEAEARYKQLVAESALVDQSQRAAIRSSELNRDQSRIELQRAEMNVQLMTVKAPMAGIVVMQSIVRNGEFGQVREGDQVFPGMAFMQIVDPSSMVLNATVNQVDAERLRLGMKATVRLDAYPELRLPGTLVGIGAMSRTSTFRASYVGEIPIRIKIEGSDPRLIPDLTGSAEIELDRVKETLIIPRSSIVDEADGSYVFVQSPEGWTRRRVELGLANYTHSSVRSGVQKGEVIALQHPL